MASAYAWISDALHGASLAGTGIIYTLTVAGTGQLADFLATQGHQVAAYSSATPTEARAELERKLLAHELRALVATSSLGMGLDMPDLSFVVHLGSPSSPIAYYQQVGRAGRALSSAAAVLLPTYSDSKIWAYFDSTAFPPEWKVRKVLDALDAAGRPMTLPKLEVESGMRRGRLESLLKVLDVDGAVERVDGGWMSTSAPWVYDSERYAGIAAARLREQGVMRAYQQGETCLMKMVRVELDDPNAADCGRCSVCTGTLPVPGLTPNPESVTAALTHLRTQTVVLEPRKMWPSGSPRRGKIAEGLRAEPGRALALAEDAAWIQPVTAALSGDFPVTDELFQGLVRTLTKWGWPAGRPTWVTWVPSRGHSALLADLADRLGSLGRMQVCTPLTADGDRFQHEAATNSESATIALSRLAVSGDIPAGPVLLLDDTTRSGFTLTTASALLRESGSGPVYPLVLHKAI
jgi:ATP-dependent DNA helicase RecQ